MLTQIINGKILTPQGWLKDGSVLISDSKILEVTKLFQHKIKEKVEYMTAMQVKTINVSVRSLSVKKQEDFYVKRTK